MLLVKDSNINGAGSIVAFIFIPEGVKIEDLQQLKKLESVFKIENNSNSCDIDINRIFSNQIKYSEIAIFDKYIASSLSISDFYIKVWKFVFLNIKPGFVASYKDIGLGIESFAYRAIGSALKYNMIHYAIPCHRVIKNDSKIGFYSSGQGIKRRLLKREGIMFDDNLRLVCQR